MACATSGPVLTEVLTWICPTEVLPTDGGELLELVMSSAKGTLGVSVLLPSPVVRVISNGSWSPAEGGSPAGEISVVTVMEGGLSETAILREGLAAA